MKPYRESISSRSHASPITGFLYPPDSAWQFPATRIPLILLLDFIVGLLLAIWLFYVGIVAIFYEKHFENAVLVPGCLQGMFRVFLAILVFMVGVGDAVIWGLAGQRGLDLRPDVLGYL
jgi:hypothetical protein